MQTESCGGSMYFLLSVDDFSRMCWVHFLKYKHEVFSKFKIFLAFVKRQAGQKLRILRTDRRGEVLSKEFNVFSS